MNFVKIEDLEKFARSILLQFVAVKTMHYVLFWILRNLQKSSFYFEEYYFAINITELMLKVM